MKNLIFSIVLLVATFSNFAFGEEEKTEEETAPTSTSTQTSPVAEEVNVDKIRERYWAQGRQSEMGVIQRRLYPRVGHFEIRLGGGITLGDPNLSISQAAVSLGYHFSELISTHLNYQTLSASPSSALAAQIALGSNGDTNEPKSILSLEGHLNFAHGKLASLGAGLFYFDVYFTGGVGKIHTETGSNLLVALGLGEQTRINQWLAFNLDYRLLIYSESFLAKIGTAAGTFGTRSNLSHSINVGATIFLNVFGS